jgi:predicted phosphoribosyltransferase
VVEEKEVIRRRLKKFRGNKPFPELRNKTVIIVDDGLASGFSMLTTLKTIEQMDAKEKIVAVPTASTSAIDLIKPYADKVVCLNIRSGHTFAVADAYKEWYDLDDEDVTKFLKPDSVGISGAFTIFISSISLSCLFTSPEIGLTRKHVGE